MNLLDRINNCSINLSTVFPGSKPVQPKAGSSIFVVSTRPPKKPLSGGMAPAVKEACEAFDNVVWYALGTPKTRSKLGNAWNAAVREFRGKDVAINAYMVEGINVRQIELGPSQWDRHYNAFSNSYEWPLLHDRPDLSIPPTPADNFGNLDANFKLAEEIAKDLKGDSETPIWIHDYHHFMLAQALRHYGVKNPIHFFNHTPLASMETLDQLSDAGKMQYSQIMRALLHCNAVSFQTAETAKRFMQAIGVQSPPEVAAFSHVPIEVLSNGHSHVVKVGHSPISINTKKIMKTASEAGGYESTAAQQLEENLKAEYIFINFERCDYSKGIKPRVQAFKELLESRPDLRGKVQLVIGAEPTRTDIQEYQDYAQAVKEMVKELNENTNYEVDGHPPVILLNQSIPHDDVLKLMRNSKEGQRKIGTVTPYTDGMNLVAKEFAAAQDPENAGPLILSSGAGAAAELGMNGNGALVYTPTNDNDVSALVKTMETAIAMPQDEANKRAQKMQNHLLKYDIGRWGQENLKFMSEFHTCPHKAPEFSARALRCN